MKLHSLAALVALAACATLPAHAPAEMQNGGAPITIGESFTLHSAALGDERQVNIWLPSDYNAADNPRAATMYSMCSTARWIRTFSTLPVWPSLGR